MPPSGNTLASINQLVRKDLAAQRGGSPPPLLEEVEISIAAPGKSEVRPEFRWAHIGGVRMEGVVTACANPKPLEMYKLPHLVTSRQAGLSESAPRSGDRAAREAKVACAGAIGGR